MRAHRTLLAATLTTSLALSGALVWLIVAGGSAEFTDPATERLDWLHTLPSWVIVAAALLPVGFMVSAVGIAVVRAVRRGRAGEA